MLRGKGYVALVVAVLTTLLSAGVVGFIDPAMADSSGPDWMFWLWSGVIVGLLGRAPFVGLLIDGNRVVRRGWVRTWTYDGSDIVAVRSRGYSGNLNRYSESRRFTMLTMKLDGRTTVTVPEATGGSASTARRVEVARTALGLSKR